MPRRPAQKPWLAEGVSRSTWYRRRKKVQETCKFPAAQNLAGSATFARAESFVAALQADLAEAARCQAVMAAIIGELAAQVFTA
jgi:hypothetical protein